VQYGVEVTSLKSDNLNEYLKITVKLCDIKLASVYMKSYTGSGTVPKNLTLNKSVGRPTSYLTQNDTLNQLST